MRPDYCPRHPTPDPRAMNPIYTFILRNALRHGHYGTAVFFGTKVPSSEGLKGKEMSISRKLVIAFIIVGLVPFAIVAAVSLWQASNALQQKSFENLQAVRTLKTNQIQDFFEGRQNDAALLTDLVSSVRNDTYAKLEGIRSVKREAVQNYFETSFSQLLSLSQSLIVLQAQRQLSKEFFAPRNLSAEASPEERASLKSYYEDEFSAEYAAQNSGAEPDVSAMMAGLDSVALRMQAQYISDNPNPLGEKHLADGSTSQTGYDWAHARFHPFFRDYLLRFGFYDIFLVDHETGKIIYSVFKEVDYATSLLTGPWKDTNFADAFRAAQTLPQGEVAFADYALYRPSYDAPASFIATPVFAGTKRVGVLVFQIPLDRVSEIMNERAGLGESGETYLVGPDFKMRSDSFHEPETHSVAASFRNPEIGLVETFAAQSALAGETGSLITENYRGKTVLTSYEPFEVGGQTWALVADVDVREAMVPTIPGQDLSLYQEFVERLRYYDLFVINKDGYIFYTVAKEADFETNILTGPYSDSGLGDLARRVTSTRAFGFADFQPYAPSNDLPAAFVAAPVLDQNGAVELIVALQISLDEINRIMLTRDGMGETGEAYLVGPDMLMRSDSFLDPTNRSVEASFGNPSTGKVETVASAEALAGRSGTEIIIDYTGNPVLSDYAPIDVLGTTWAIIAEIDESEAFAATNSLTWLILVIGAIGAGGVAAAGLLLARSLSTPITTTTETMNTLAGGDLDVEIQYVDRSDEIGEMAQAVQVFKDNALEIRRMEKGQEEERKQAEADKAAALTDLATEISSLSDAAGNGDLSVRIDLAGKTGDLRRVAESLNQMVATVDAGLGEVSKVFAALAKGDLTVRMDGTYQGAFDDLKGNSNATTDTLNGIVGNISNAAEAVQIATAEISVGTHDLSGRTEQQAASLEETSAAMEELTATVRQNAQKAQLANTLSTTARSSAEKGGEVVTDAIAAMKDISGSSKKISEIVSLIDEIAFQTNLLALNAAVEAARAGDAGKGFGVVASEVRALAQRSSEASKQISTLINTSTDQVSVGEKLVNQTGETLTEIVEAVEKVAGIVSEISTASREQSTSLDEVNAAVVNMDQMTQQNAALVEQTTAAAQSLKDQADGLTEQVGYFASSSNQE